MMLTSWLILAAMTPAQAAEQEPIQVESVVISLIDHVDLAFGEAGIVREVHFKPGMPVEKGDLLAELDSTDAELQVQRVEAELEMAKLQAANDLKVQLSRKAVGLAKAELQRAVRSNEKFAETVSASEIDRLTLARDQAELQIKQAEHDQQYATLQMRLKAAELAITRRNLERRKLLSPLGGVVAKVDLQAGEWAQPDQSFWRIISIDRVRAEGFIDSLDGNVQVGQSVSLTLPDRTRKTKEFEGVITFVDLEIDSITGQYRIWAEIVNEDNHLRPGHHPNMVVNRTAPRTASRNVNTTAP